MITPRQWIISQKYGKEAIQHPKADWTDEKEKEYLIANLFEKRVSKKNATTLTGLHS